MRLRRAVFLAIVASLSASPASAEPFEWRIDFAFHVTDMVIHLSDPDTQPAAFNPLTGVMLGDAFDGSFHFSTHTEDPETLIGPAGIWDFSFSNLPASLQSTLGSGFGPHRLNLGVHGSTVADFALGVELGPTSLDIDDGLMRLAYEWMDDGGRFGRQTAIASTQIGPLQRVPEPSTMLLFAVGIAGVALRRRRASN